MPRPTIVTHPYSIKDLRPTIEKIKKASQYWDNFIGPDNPFEEWKDEPTIILNEHTGLTVVDYFWNLSTIDMFIEHGYGQVLNRIQLILSC